MSNRMVSISITVKATEKQIEHLKQYTRDLGMERWEDFLEEAALDVIPSEAEIVEMEKQ